VRKPKSKIQNLESGRVRFLNEARQGYVFYYEKWPFSAANTRKVPWLGVLSSVATNMFGHNKLRPIVPKYG